jgi:hypothetical protein
MIKKTKNGFLIKCDKCGYEEEIDTHDDMEVFKEIINGTGWKSRHSFKNICEDCWSVQK